MALVNIKTIAAAARARGFKVYGGESYVEIWEPEHKGPEAVWNFDSRYSTSQFTLSDRPRRGYGYNDFFYGPWHTGMIPTDDFVVLRLLAHPAMAGYVA